MRTKIFRWAIVVALFYSNHVAGQIWIRDEYLKYELADIEKIVADYSTKRNCCEGIKQDMRTACKISKIVLMRQYKEKILQSYDSTYFQHFDYDFLCFLDNLPDSIVQVGINQPESSLLFKAKYGDSISLNLTLSRVKKCFFSNEDDEIANEASWPMHISNLLLIGNKESLSLFYKILESTKYGDHWSDGRQNYKISIAYIAIQIYLALYPPEKPVSKIDIKQFEVDEHPIESIEDINQADFKQYVADVEKYISRREKRKVRIKTKYFHLGEYTVGKYYIYP